MMVGPGVTTLNEDCFEIIAGKNIFSEALLVVQF